MISVCMATYNGEKFIKEQIDSILCQLSENDELIISDDYSTDKTVDIIKSYVDPRIKLYYNGGIKGCTHNFENALKKASGDFIFLSDQDDIWLPGKISKMILFLQKNEYDLVMCNYILVNEKLEIMKSPFYDENYPMKRSVISNLYKCVGCGCCLTFTKRALGFFLPFPTKVVLHDLWIFLFAITNLKCGYCYDPLLLSRRHQGTVTFVGKKNTHSFFFKVKYRLYVMLHLIYRSFKYYVEGIKTSID